MQPPAGSREETVRRAACLPPPLRQTLGESSHERKLRKSAAQKHMRFGGRRCEVSIPRQRIMRP